ncbi:MAG: hypothetical protein JKX97_09140 [Candidatus Lindowbacteria bacterium]|nr:hypothetical protein [Candidatus Lindowbacteria bacterium]
MIFFNPESGSAFSRNLSLVWNVNADAILSHELLHLLRSESPPEQQVAVDCFSSSSGTMSLSVHVIEDGLVRRLTTRLQDRPSNCTLPLAPVTRPEFNYKHLNHLFATEVAPHPDLERLLEWVLGDGLAFSH